MKFIIGAIAGLLLTLSASAQELSSGVNASSIPSVCGAGPNQLLGTNGATPAGCKGDTISNWFDSLFCSTVGQITARVTGTTTGWACTPDTPVSAAWFGVKGDGSTNNDTAFANLYAALQANQVGYARNGSGGIVVLPPGVNCTFTGLTWAIPGLIVQGASQPGTAISNCNHDVTPFTANASQMLVSNLQFWGAGIPGIGNSAGGILPTSNALVMGPACQQCKFHMVGSTGGLDGMLFQSADHVADKVYATYAYANLGHISNTSFEANGRIHDSTFDQVWPLQLPSARSQSLSNWSNNGGAGTAYAVGTVAVFSNANGHTYYMQAGRGVASASVAAGGSGGGSGACTFAIQGGTVGTNQAGGPALATVTGTVTGGALSGSLTISYSGYYASFPSSPANALPISGPGCGAITGVTVSFTQTNGTGGTGTQPTVAPYLTVVADAGVVWQLVADTTSSSFHFDGGSSETIVDSTDFSSSQAYNILIDAANGGSAPININLHHNVISQAVYLGFGVFAGSGHIIEGNTILSGASQFGDVMQFNGAFSGNSQIRGNRIGNGYIGIEIATGTGNIISDNICGISSLLYCLTFDQTFAINTVAHDNICLTTNQCLVLNGTGLDYLDYHDNVHASGQGVLQLDVPGSHVRITNNLGYIGNGNVTGTTQVGNEASAATLSIGEIGQAKITASGTAPGGGFAKLEWVAGTNSGTCKLISYAGTSSTAVTIVDNVGGSC